MTTKFKSDAFEAIHNSAAGMFRAGTIDKATMRRFDKSCLTVVIFQKHGLEVLG